MALSTKSSGIQMRCELPYEIAGKRSHHYARSDFAFFSIPKIGHNGKIKFARENLNFYSIKYLVFKYQREVEPVTLHAKNILV